MGFSSDDLTAMQQAQQAHMMDTCVVQTPTITQGDYNEEKYAWTDGSAIVCGLDQGSGSEQRKSNMTPVEYDAVVRLPINTVLDAKCRIKVTHRFGVALATALIYDIVSPIEQGPSGIRVMLRKIDVKVE